MAWSELMRSRVVNAVLAVALTVPMGVPSAFAFAQADHLRQRPARTNPDATGEIGRAEAEADPGKTFVASMLAGTEPTPADRAWFDKHAGGVIGEAFGRRTTVVFGPGTPAIEEQTKDTDRLNQARIAHELITEAARAIGIGEEFSRRRLVLVFGDDLALLSRGGLHLIGLSGRYDWQRSGASPASHYAPGNVFGVAHEALGEGGAKPFAQVVLDAMRHMDELRASSSGELPRPT